MFLARGISFCVLVLQVRVSKISYLMYSAHRWVKTIREFSNWCCLMLIIYCKYMWWNNKCHKNDAFYSIEVYSNFLLPNKRSAPNDWIYGTWIWLYLTCPQRAPPYVPWTGHFPAHVCRWCWGEAPCPGCCCLSDRTPAHSTLMPASRLEIKSTIHTFPAIQL